MSLSLSKDYCMHHTTGYETGYLYFRMPSISRAPLCVLDHLTGSFYSWMFLFWSWNVSSPPPWSCPWDNQCYKNENRSSNTLGQIKHNKNNTLFLTLVSSPSLLWTPLSIVKLSIVNVYLQKKETVQPLPGTAAISPAAVSSPAVT